MTEHPIYPNRQAAGAALAERLLHLNDDNPLILGIPGGGVVVGAEIASRLGAPLSTVQLTVDTHRSDIGVRMRSRPGQKGMFDSGTGTRTPSLSRSRAAIPTATMPDVSGRTVVVVDDGLHDDIEVHQTLQAFRGRGATRLIFAVPFTASTAVERHRSEVDEIVALNTPLTLEEPREWYTDATSPDLEEVQALLKKYPMDNSGIRKSTSLYRQILVPYDFSDTARRALNEAIRVARSTGTPLHLMHIVPAERAEEEVLPEANTLADIAEHPVMEGLSVSHSVTYGAADERILEAIGTGSYDLVVMGTNGRQGLRRVLMGSVAQKVIRESPVPVMVLS